MEKNKYVKKDLLGVFYKLKKKIGVKKIKQIKEEKGNRQNKM